MKQAKKINNIMHHGDYSEKMIEAYLCNETRKRGGLPLKYSNSQESGYPDRILLMPGGITLWVEVKSKGQKPRPLQVKRFERMAKVGHVVSVVDSKEAVDLLLLNFKEADYAL